MALAYLPSIHKYISDRFLWTDEELDNAERERQAWERTQCRFSPTALIEIYGPQAKVLLRRYLKNIIVECDTDLLQAEEYKEALRRRQNDWTVHPDHMWFVEMFYEVMLIDPLVAGRMKKIKEARWYLAQLTPPHKGDVFNEANAVTQGVTSDMITQARTVPIDSLIEAVPRRKTKCLWHEDSSPSLHLFPDNHVYCFSCNKSADAIDVMMALRDVGFVEAVKILTT